MWKHMELGLQHKLSRLSTNMFGFHKKLHNIFSHHFFCRQACLHCRLPHFYSWFIYFDFFTRKQKDLNGLIPKTVIVQTWSLLHFFTKIQQTQQNTWSTLIFVLCGIKLIYTHLCPRNSPNFFIYHCFPRTFSQVSQPSNTTEELEF